MRNGLALVDYRDCKLGCNRLEVLRSSYQEAFPESERRPWYKIIAGASEGKPAVYLIVVNGEDVGLLSWWDLPYCVYFEHFFVRSDQRSGGVGTSALDLFRAVAAEHKKPIVLEVEPPTDSKMAKRRLDFYTRNGFHVLTEEYLQPPYIPGLPTVKLWLLTTGNNKEMDAHRIAAHIHHFVYGIQ